MPKTTTKEPSLLSEGGASGRDYGSTFDDIEVMSEDSKSDGSLCRYVVNSY